MAFQVYKDSEIGVKKIFQKKIKERVSQTNEKLN